MSAEQEEIRQVIRDICYHLVDSIPDSARPFWFNPWVVKQTLEGVIVSIPEESLLEMATFTFQRLDGLFDKFGKDWIRSQVKGTRPEFQHLREYLQKTGISYF